MSRPFGRKLLDASIERESSIVLPAEGRHHGEHVPTPAGDGIEDACAWVQKGGFQVWLERLRDPSCARSAREMRDPARLGKLYVARGAAGVRARV